jgi:hypothetical protein
MATLSTPVFMAIKLGGEVVRTEMRNAIDQLVGCATPICDATARGEAELVGSAVLINVSGETFLCTANHVIEHNVSSTLYFDGPSQLEILHGDFLISAEHDIAVMKLSEAQAIGFGKYSPLQEYFIGNSVQTEASKIAEFLGFPCSKNRIAHNANKIKGLLQSNADKVIETTSSRVRIYFDKKRNINTKTRQVVQAPDPFGMSGGAMFGVPLNCDTIEGVVKPKLIGISTHDIPSKKEVYGASIAVVLKIIRDGWQVSLPDRLNPTI